MVVYISILVPFAFAIYGHLAPATPARVAWPVCITVMAATMSVVTCVRPWMLVDIVLSTYPPARGTHDRRDGDACELKLLPDRPEVVCSTAPMHGRRKRRLFRAAAYRNGEQTRCAPRAEQPHLHLSERSVLTSQDTYAGTRVDLTSTRSSPEEKLGPVRRLGQCTRTHDSSSQRLRFGSLADLQDGSLAKLTLIVTERSRIQMLAFG
jgi:hypothetical protein